MGIRISRRHILLQFSRLLSQKAKPREELQGMKTCLLRYGISQLHKEGFGDMPKALHDKLARQAAKEGLKGDRKNAYVYGTLNKIEGKTSKGPTSKRERKFGKKR